MKKKISNIFILSISFTILGFLIDGDQKEPSTIMRFIEFFAMTGITFVTFSILYLNF